MDSLNAFFFDLDDCRLPSTGEEIQTVQIAGQSLAFVSLLSHLLVAKEGLLSRLSQQSFQVAC
jgi:hypothetical protein